MNRLRGLMFLFAGVFLAVSTVLAADVAGKWSGSIDVGNGGAPVRTAVQLRLERKGDLLTGEIGREGDAEQVAIKNGRVEGNRVYFEASGHETEGPMHFRLMLAGNRLTGEMTGEVQQRRITGRVNLTREEQ